VATEERLSVNPAIDLPLQLMLWEWLDEAAQVVAQLPELVMVQDGVAILDAALEDLSQIPLSVQLSIAAQAIDQLAGLYQRKAEELLFGWENQAAIGATLSLGWSVGLVRQPVAFDLSTVVEPVAEKLPRRSKRNPAVDPEDSIAAPIPKENAIAFLDAITGEDADLQSQLAALAGDESPAQWQAAIDRSFASFRDPVSLTFSQLQQQTELAPVELWLGLLLGSYQLSQIPQPLSAIEAIAFYTNEVWVTPMGAIDLDFSHGTRNNVKD
jgi:hypothetical protein